MWEHRLEGSDSDSREMQLSSQWHQTRPVRNAQEGELSIKGNDENAMHRKWLRLEENDFYKIVSGEMWFRSVHGASSQRNRILLLEKKNIYRKHSFSAINILDCRTWSIKFNYRADENGRDFIYSTPKPSFSALPFIVHTKRVKRSRKMSWKDPSQAHAQRIARLSFSHASFPFTIRNVVHSPSIQQSFFCASQSGAFSVWKSESDKLLLKNTKRLRELINGPLIGRHCEV